MKVTKEQTPMDNNIEIRKFYSLFKTLEFTHIVDCITYGRFVHIISEKDLAGGEIPQLMQIGTTMKKLKKMYPKQDFTGVNLITLKVEPSK